MKKLSYIVIAALLTAFSILDGLSQNCKKFHLYGTCMQYSGPSYKMDMQSRSNIIGIGDKLTYNVVFYGERDYKLYFCASELFNPVHYILTDGGTGELIYDSQKDDYAEMIELSIDNTRKIMIEISVLAHKADPQVTDNYFGCVGFLMDWKPMKK